jgi:hypothetical protein
VQVNIRIDDEVVEALDSWTVIRCASRPDLIREAITEWLARREDECIAEQYRRTYEEFPETDDEMARAEANAWRAVEEEPWERWW